MGVMIQGYQGDNGIFTAKEFTEHLTEFGQDVKLS